MSAATLHIIIEQGSKFEKQLTLKKAGVVLNITGWTFKGQIRKSQLKTSDLVGAFVFTTVDAPNGRVDMTILDTLTAPFPVGTHRYDVEYDDGSGIDRRMLQGDAKVDAEVTTT